MSEAAGLTLRVATPADVPALTALIEASARQLGRGFYTEAQSEAAIAHVFGVDAALIADGSYLIAERDGRIAGCGGWSARRTLFGGDRYAVRDDARLDPGSEPARIRAFFVAPDAARGGIGSALLAACEEASLQVGFTQAALMATLPGVPFYAARGWRAEPAVTLEIGGEAVPFVPMSKPLLPSRNNEAIVEKIIGQIPDNLLQATGEPIVST